jgi:hypothetical protein
LTNQNRQHQLYRICNYSFTVYLIMLTETKPIVHQIRGWLVNNKLICRRNQSWYHPAICLGLKKPTEKTVRIYSLHAKIGIHDLKNTKLACYQFNCDISVGLAACIIDLKMVYYSYFHSIMNYGLIFWGNSSYRNNIFRLQKRIIRIIMDASSWNSEVSTTLSRIPSSMENTSITT